MAVALGFLYGVWVCLALLTIYIIGKALQDPHDDH